MGSHNHINYYLGCAKRLADHGVEYSFGINDIYYTAIEYKARSVGAALEDSTADNQPERSRILTQILHKIHMITSEAFFDAIPEGAGYVLTLDRTLVYEEKLTELNIEFLDLVGSKKSRYSQGLDLNQVAVDVPTEKVEYVLSMIQYADAFWPGGRKAYGNFLQNELGNQSITCLAGILQGGGILAGLFGKLTGLPTLYMIPSDRNPDNNRPRSMIATYSLPDGRIALIDHCVSTGESFVVAETVFGLSERFWTVADQENPQAPRADQTLQEFMHESILFDMKKQTTVKII